VLPPGPDPRRHAAQPITARPGTPSASGGRSAAVSCVGQHDLPGNASRRVIMEGDTSRLSATDAGADANLLLEVVMDVLVLIGRILFGALFDL